MFNVFQIIHQNIDSLIAPKQLTLFEVKTAKLYVQRNPMSSTKQDKNLN